MPRPGRRAYFGRGITWVNAINDQVAGIGRYTFTEPTDERLRPFRDLTEPSEEEHLPDGSPSG